MTFAEAFAELQQIIGPGGYGSLQVEAERNRDGTVTVKWRAYNCDRTPKGWSEECATAEAVLADLRGDPPPPQTVDGIDPIVDRLVEDMP